ncbi:MAG: T9SS type A sorting domain-containing protein [Bacteroidetes bacterium]|nr:T9SS type A sorting domain-containing protein [Bacteroidota bacterium]
MKKLFSIISFILFSTLAFSQARMVINDNGYLVIDNAAYLVIDNSATNALAVAGTGGNIKSEAETDRIKWNIAATTGTYTIPWTTNTGVKIPLSINKTTAGVGAGNFLLSTWETADMNTPWPSAVTNMNSSVIPATDGSLEVIDRFWHINALSYGTKPSVTLSFGYDDAANEMIGTNTITEANLQAQRFNTGSSNWEATKLFGTVNVATNTVSGAAITPVDFFENWVLVDNTSPLPVTLTHFSAECSGKEIKVTWTTQTEINNDYFVLEKSYDGFVFFEVAEINGSGNSNVSNNYQTSVEAENKIVYFRLKQVDFDGTTSYHNIVASNCSNNTFEVTQMALTRIYLYDYRGRLVIDRNEFVTKGLNTIKINNLDLSAGIYMLSVVGQNNVYSTKLLRR